MYIMNPICGYILCQHARGDCTIKSESNRFRILLSTTRSQRRSLPFKSTVRRHQTLPKFSEILSLLLCCAYATGCTENRSLLTEQALFPLSEASLFRQQSSASSYEVGLAAWLLLCCRKWILQVPAVLFCHKR